MIFLNLNLDEQKKKEQNRSLRRSNSTESSNHIPLVDDKSLDSTSGNNTESENPKQQRIKSKKKDVETNTDSKTNSRNGNYQQQQQQQEGELFFSVLHIDLSFSINYKFV